MEYKDTVYIYIYIQCKATEKWIDKIQIVVEMSEENIIAFWFIDDIVCCVRVENTWQSYLIEEISENCRMKLNKEKIKVMFYNDSNRK